LLYCHTLSSYQLNLLKLAEFFFDPLSPVSDCCSSAGTLRRYCSPALYPPSNRLFREAKAEYRTFRCSRSLVQTPGLQLHRGRESNSSTDLSSELRCLENTPPALDCHRSSRP